MTDCNWYFERDGQAVGPHDDLQFLRLFAEKTVDVAARVREGADGEWTTIALLLKQGRFHAGSDVPAATGATPDLAAPTDGHQTNVAVRFALAVVGACAGCTLFLVGLEAFNVVSALLAGYSLQSVVHFSRIDLQPTSVRVGGAVMLIAGWRLGYSMNLRALPNYVWGTAAALLIVATASIPQVQRELANVVFGTDANLKEVSAANVFDDPGVPRRNEFGDPVVVNASSQARGPR